MSQSAAVAKPIAESVDACEARGFRLGYLKSFDGLRGIAVLMVIAHHARLPFSTGGFLGVDLFFVLSGFLITTLLLEERDRNGSISLKNFYMRRVLRLLPALVALLLFLCLYAALFLPGARAEEIYKASFITLFYQSNWAEAFHVAPLGVLYHTWSLSIEEQFYLLWPPLLILLLRLRLKRHWVLSLVLAAATASALYRAAMWAGQDSVARLYNGLDTRADSLLIGCATGLLATWGMLPDARWMRVALRVILIALLPVLLYSIATQSSASGYLYRGGFTLVSVGVAIMITELLGAPPGLQVLESAPLVWVGRLSYGLYLWNFPVCYIVTKPGLSPALLVSLQVAGTFAAASLSFYLIERPFLRMKRRFAAGSAERLRGAFSLARKS